MELSGFCFLVNQRKLALTAGFVLTRWNGIQRVSSSAVHADGFGSLD